jgi:tRNA threonylcarbamoyladenosine biosynthesis protein TsaB
MSNKGSPQQHASISDGTDGATRGRGPRFADAARPLVLAVDTASDVRSVAAARGRETLSLVRERETKAGASVVLSVIDEALRCAGVRFEEVELFAVAVGPGSFTGIRAGLATVKAFAAMMNRRVASVPTLHAVGLAAGASERTVAAIPAGRGEVFAQLLEVSADGAVRELNEAAHVSPAALARAALGWGETLRWAGGGAWQHRELVAEAARGAGRSWGDSSGVGGSAVAGPGAWSLAPRRESYGEQIARLGLIRSAAGMAIRAEEVTAFYVRPSDAELK